MSFACHSYIIRIYSCVIRMPLVYTRMSSVCYSYTLICQPYVTRIHSYVLRMSLVCTRMASVSHSYVLVCHPYSTRMNSYAIRVSLVCGFTVNLSIPYNLSFFSKIKQSKVSKPLDRYIKRLVCNEFFQKIHLFHQPG